MLWAVLAVSMEKSLVYVSEQTRNAMFPLLVVVSGAFLFLLEYSIGTALLWTVPGAILGLWAIYLVFGGEVLLMGKSELALLHMGKGKVSYKKLSLAKGAPRIAVEGTQVIVENEAGSFRFGEYLQPARLAEVAHELEVELSQISSPKQP